MLACQRQQRHAMAEATNAHLTRVQRCKIEGFLSSGHSQRSIARQLGVASSTVCRVVQRNAASDGSYDGSRAHQMAVKRRCDASSQPRKVTPTPRIHSSTNDR